MGLTSRFSLSQFGGGVEGSLSRDGGKHTGRDRRVIDRILEAFENHAHQGGVRLQNPEFSPDLTLSTTGGSLRAGQTYHYAVTFIDQYGLETAPTDSASVTTEGSISNPPPPRVEAEVGGSLEEGLHWYALTSFQDGNETALSAPSAINITDWNTVRIEAPNGLPSGSDAVSVWRQGPLDSGFTRLVTVSVADPALPPDPLFTDDGSIESTCGPGCIPGPDLLPPSTNLTNSTNSTLIEVPSIPAEAIAWRVYRTTQSGVWQNSLVAEVVETESELSGALVTSYLDEGGATLPGMPPPFSQTLTPTREVAGGSGSTGVQSEGGYVTGQLAYSRQDIGDAWLLHVQGNHLYTMSYSSGEDIAVFDVSEKAWPRLVAEFAPGTPGYVSTILGEGSKLYATSIDAGNSEFYVIDASDPANLAIEGTLAGLTGVGDGSAALAWPYVFAGTDDGVHVIDVSDPTAPALVATMALSLDSQRARVSRRSAREMAGSVSLVAGHGGDLAVFQVQVEGSFSYTVEEFAVQDAADLMAVAWVGSDIFAFDNAESSRMVLLSTEGQVIDTLALGAESNFVDVSEGYVYFGHTGARVIDARGGGLAEVAQHQRAGAGQMADVFVRRGMLYFTAFQTSELSVFGGLPHFAAAAKMRASAGAAQSDGLPGSVSAI